MNAAVAKTEAEVSRFKQDIVDALPKIRRTVIGFCKDTSLAEDILQETALRAMANASQFEDGTNLAAWLTTIAKNYFLSSVRKLGREVEDIGGAISGSTPVEGNQQQSAEFQELIEAINRLPNHMRKPIRMVGLLGHSYEETAKACGIPEGTVKSQVNRARVLLGDYGAKMFEGESLVQVPGGAETVQDRGFLYRLAKHYVNEHQGDTQAAIAAMIARLLQDRRALEEVVSAAIKYIVVNMTKEVVISRRQQIVTRAQQGRGAVVALAAGISAAILDMPLGSGARLRNATRAEVSAEADKHATLAKNASHKARWLALIAQSVPDGKTVGDVLTDERAQELWNEAQNESR